MILDSTGIAFTQNTIAAIGPTYILMVRDTVIPFTGRIGGPFCSGAVYYEVIFKTTAGVLNPPNSAAIRNYDICPPCCVNQIQNISTNSNACTSFSIRAQPDGQGGFFYPNMSTLGTTRRPLQEAYADLDNLNDFGLSFIPGVDSIRYSLDGMPQGGGTNAAYNAGFSISTPLPDVSEDSLNGQNVFIPETGALRSMAVDSGFVEGNYAVGIARTTYYKGEQYTVDRSAYLVYYHYRDTAIAAFDLRLRTPDSVFRTNEPSTHLTYNLDFGDSLEIDITALGSAGDVMVLLSDSILEPLDISILPAGANFNLPKLISLNPGGGFVNLDSNAVRFSFNPTLDNLRYMRGRTFFKVVFGQNTCRGDVHSVLIEVLYNPKPRILIWDEERDSVEVCMALSPQLEVLRPNGSFRWVPAALFSSATNKNTTVTAKIDRWYYLVNPSTAQLVDSIYLSFNPVDDTLYHITADTIGSKMILNEPAVSTTQVWRIADMVDIEYQVEDELPILGPGDYNVLSYLGPFTCPNFSDTAIIPYNSIWAANYGKTQGADSVLLDTIGSTVTRYNFRVRPSNDLVRINELYIKGLKDLSKDGSASVFVNIQTSRGLTMFQAYKLNQGTFVSIPLSALLANTDSLEITIILSGQIAYHKLEIPTASFNAGAFEYFNHRVAFGNTTFQTTTNSLPIGFEFANAIGLEEFNNADAIAVYPSPTSSLLHVEANDLSSKSWQLSSLNGTKLAQGTFHSNEAELDISRLPAGIYLLSVDGQVHKVVKE